MVRDLNADPKDKKTYGRTPDGTIFVVPTTHDMVSQLLDPRKRKNVSDVCVLAILGLHILAAWLLPSGLKKAVFAGVFLFWRAAYNVGIGWLLKAQSNHRLLVRWASKSGLFDFDESACWLRTLLKRELEAKVDYTFESATIEYNTWLVFRRVVDLILMCDFVSYCLFAAICGHGPEGEKLVVAICRWVLGVAMVGFNLWVKLDAHRVVKDYAWYWGDFFYLIDQELTFDGVFEMAPHPMYSIGYAGYYGISLMAASYDVLFISIMAHAAQFAFLMLVENPHIEKTYNPPPPRMPVHADGVPVQGWRQLHIFHTTDSSLVLMLAYLTVLTLVTPTTPVYQAVFVAHALLWRVWLSFGLGLVLRQQSASKMFTRHFLKYGESVDEAWRQWKALYHISLVMSHAALIAACWNMYEFPEDWNYGFALLNHVVGLGLVALQMWTSASIYESLGEFGWFFGDFFYEKSSTTPTYTSIYRYLNNPERVMGTAGLWGAALVTRSSTMFGLALVGHLLTLAFISYVERPHMQKIYGGKLRQEAGLTKFIKKSLPPGVKEWQESMDRVLDDTKNMVDDFLDAARARLAAGSSSMVRDYAALFNKYPARLTITRMAPNLTGLDPEHYSLTVESLDPSRPAVLEYGAPVRLKWRAPANHAEKDWVALYKVTDNRSREATELSSLGRWVPTCPAVYDTSDDEGILSWDVPVADSAHLVQGEMVFSGDKLWWTRGVFEFRYHHDGHHNVMATSDPFEVRVPRFGHDQDPVDEDDVAEALLGVVRNCLDRDPDVAPVTVDEPFGGKVARHDKYAKRVVYAIRHMFGVEFAPAVVRADGNVKRLAWRVANAKQVLAPYSMSSGHARGDTTPVTDKFPEGEEST